MRRVKIATRAVVVMLLFGCTASLVWMLQGQAATDSVVGNSNVVGGVASVVALALAVILLWPRATKRGGYADEQVRAATEYLAVETLRYWKIQAKDRQITTPSAVAVTWRWAGYDVAVPARLSQILTTGTVTRLREQLYEQLGEETHLVILGGAGAGKTAAMLLLLLDILKHRPVGSTQPVPVWLTLGGWNPQTTSMQEWAVTTLTRDYPGLLAHGGRGTAGELIRTRRVTLFLDGLDELPPALQGRALQTIDHDELGARLVLTSRPDDYRTALAQGRLWGAAVIDLLPVDLEDAKAFLLAEQLDPRRRSWQHVIDHMRAHPDSVPARTLTSPLALSLARYTYTQADPTALLDVRVHPTPNALLQHLLARSLDLAYPDPSQRQHAIRWLGWIAHQMGDTMDLRWWDIPTWLPQWQRRFLVLLAGSISARPRTLVVRRPNKKEAFRLLVSGFIFGLMGTFLGWLADEARNGWLTDGGSQLPRWLGDAGHADGGLMFGLPGGLTFGLAIGAVDLLGKMTSEAQASTPAGVYDSDCRQALTFSFAAGLAFGLLGGPAFGLAAGLASLLPGGLTLGLAAGLALGFTSGLASGLMVGLAWGLGFGLVGLMRLPGSAAPQLIMAEMAWRLRGQRVRFLPLLETALKRQVLRQVGSKYQFRHAALQDLLVQISAPEMSGPRSSPGRPDVPR
jgi:hypothetical protein